MLGGGMNGIGNLVKMARQLQLQAVKLREDVESREFTGSAGGGAVKVIAKGSGELLSVEISEDFLKSADPETIQDAIVAAVNQALKEARETLAEEMKKLSGNLGFDLGGLF